MTNIKNIIGIITTIFCIFTILTLPFSQKTFAITDTTTDTTDTTTQEPIDINTYHKTNNPTLNLNDFGDFTPVETAGEFSTKIITFLMSILGGVAMLGIIAGGIMIMGGGMSENTMENGKTLLLYSVIGVGIALLAMVIVTLSQSFLYSFGK